MPATTLNVSLLTMTPDAIPLLYACAKQCTSADDAADMFARADLHRFADGYIPVEDKDRLIRRVIDSGHTSILECVIFSFAISGISRACSHQLVRHRVGCSYAQQSQRYVRADDFSWVLPPQIAAVQAALDRYEFAMEEAADAYADIILALKAAGRGDKAAEDARFVLPNACATKLVVTMNCRALLHFFEERTCNRSQWEIRAMAKAMLEICKDKLPVVFANAGPKCKRLGRCPEAKPCRQHMEQMAKEGGAA